MNYRGNMITFFAKTVLKCEKYNVSDSFRRDDQRQHGVIDSEQSRT